MDYLPYSETPTQTRPYGPVAGVDAGINSIYSNAAKIQGLDDMVAMAARRQAELERYRGQTPNELAKSNLEGAQATAQMPYAGDFALGERGKSRSLAAKGDVDYGTKDTSIGAQNEKNRLGGYQAILNFIDLHEPALKSAAPGLEQQATYQRMLSQIPESARDIFPKVYDGGVHDTMKDIKDKLTNSIAHLQEMEKTKLENKGKAEVATITGQYGLAREREKAAIKNKSTKQMLMDALSKGDDNRIINLEAFVANDDDIDSNMRMRLKEAAMQARKNLAEKMAKGQIDLNNPMGGPGPIAEGINSRLGGQQQSPYGKTPQGYDIIGKNPDGSYRIRDPQTGRTGTYRP